MVTIMVSGRDLLAHAESAPMDGNLRLGVLVLLLPIFPPISLIHCGSYTAARGAASRPDLWQLYRVFNLAAFPQMGQRPP